MSRMPFSTARFVMLAPNGPANISGNSVIMSMRIVRLLRQIDDHAAARDVDLAHDGLERRYEQFASVRARAW